MEVQAVLVRAALAVQKELTELAGAERGPDHALGEHKLVHRENCDGRLPRVAESEVRRVAGPSPRRVVHVVSIHDDLLQISILAKVLYGLQLFFVCNLGRQAYYVHQRLLNDSQVRQLFYLVLGERLNRNFGASALRAREAQRLQRFNAATASELQQRLITCR